MENHAPARPLLFDRAFWCEKLAELRAIPRHLLIVPRPEHSRPGIEVAEIKLRAHDGTRLSALFGRATFGREGQPVRIRVVSPTELRGVCWSTLEAGRAELCFRPAAGRRLEDRVLDLLRIVDAVSSLEGVDAGPIEIVAPVGAIPDEVWIVRQVLQTCGELEPSEG